MKHFFIGGGSMNKALPVGVSDFEKIRNKEYYYVDKTLMIAEWLELAAEVTLITRPRRFGKTLNMTMLREFFDITKDSEELFAGLDISRTDCMSELNEWPVIFLSFKDCKGSYEEVMTCIYKALLGAFKPIADSSLSDIEKKILGKTIDTLTELDLDKKAIVQDTIFTLSQTLYRQYNKKVIILIDEYDTPMINAYEQGYYDEVRFFFTSLYSSALKDNPYLERAMLTGIHRIAKENIFSGLNNPSVCTVLSEKYQQYFGLTPEETGALLKYYDLRLNEQVKAMYDGYRFGTQEIYNPWSIINYADNKKMEAYWVNTASNEMLVQAMLNADQDVKEDFEVLLAQSQVRVPVDLQTSFFEIEQSATLWGLFLNSGYLTVQEAPEIGDLQNVCIPNQEVLTSFRKIIERYGGFRANSLAKLFDALQRKAFDAFKRAYEQIILTCTSFHDGSAENAYHMLFLGMCVYLNGEYQVRSNIECGHGRVDIVLEAKRPGKPNFVIEFKQGEDIEELAQAAMVQIHEKKYYAGLKGETILLGIAHNLKQCHIIHDTI